ncbi:PepSY-associated TM helix domain-containing protein [Cloacibacterium sp.]|uniref:PepSY-associated TM helix domain-containing protein n=1 Tax=Cloacibacterium sp. TaxID=1913682 RepID=UPI0039E4BCC1
MKKKLLKSIFRKRRKNETFFKYLMWISHFWLGILSSIVVFVVCFTGCLYAFKNQITEIYNRDKVFVEKVSNAKKFSADDVQNQFLKNHKKITALTISNDEGRSVSVSYEENGVAQTTFFNQYTGEELGAVDTSLNVFFETVLDLHKNLLMGNVGRQILGAGVLMFVFLLFSGFVLWLPKRIRNLKQSLTVKWNARFQRLNYDLHNTLGFYTFLLLFFIAITGLYVTYPWVKNILIVSLGGESISSINAENKESDDAFAGLLLDMIQKQNEKKEEQKVKISLDEILKKADDVLFYKAVTTIELPNKENPRFVVSKINTTHFLGMMLPDEVTFDKNGELKTKDLFLDKPLNEQITALVKPLHTGEIMGLPSIILYFIVCLIGCSLPVTGIVIWWQRLQKQKV